MNAKRKIGIFSLALLLLAGIAPVGVRAQPAREQVLPGCGICFPGGYDVNSAGEVEGTLLEVQKPLEGPVRLLLAGGGERWVVLTAPGWYWERARPQFAVGDRLVVRGSKTLGADGSLYVVAREIQLPGSGSAFVLRECGGAPLWSGGRHGGRGTVGAAGECRARGAGGGRNGF